VSPGRTANRRNCHGSYRATSPRDEKHKRRETAGIELLVNGIAMAHRDDEARLVRACATLDELYEYYKRRRPDRVR